VNYTWYGEAIDDAPTFTTDLWNISNRTKTTASVNEDALAWVSEWNNGPEIKTIIEEIVTRELWEANNDLVIINDWISGAGLRSSFSHEYHSSYCAKLHIEYAQGVPPGLENKSANMAAKMVGAGLI